MKGLTIEQKRAHRSATQAAMKRRAESLRCPKCARKGALVKIRSSHGVVEVVVCRWKDCGYERPGVALTDVAVPQSGTGGEETKR